MVIIVGDKVVNRCSVYSDFHALSLEIRYISSKEVK